MIYEEKWPHPRNHKNAFGLKANQEDQHNFGKH